MRTDIIRGVLLAFLLLGFAVPGVALAEDDERGCSNLGTWFGVFGPEDTRLTGWSVTVAGKSELMGTNNISFPTFDPSFPDVEELQGVEPFASAAYVGTLRGNWKRVAKNTFAYTFMGLAFDEYGVPVYIAKFSGQHEVEGDCRFQHISGAFQAFWPWVSPFDGDPILTLPLGNIWAYRAEVALPY